MRFLILPAAIAAASSLAAAAPITERAAGDTTTVSLDTCSGTPALYGAGMLYGISGTDTPPQSCAHTYPWPRTAPDYADLKINYQSSGGAQSDASPGGFATSASSYRQRFDTVVAAFKRIRQNNGVLIIKLADLWGADETGGANFPVGAAEGANFPFPGDGGDWSKFDAFMQQIIDDVRANGMAVEGATQLELWNEPDINFGGRPQEQFNEMYVRGTKALHAAFPQGGGSFLPLVGPSTSSNPAAKNAWWQSFLAYLQANGGTASQPDVWNWHMEEGGNNDPIPPAEALPGFVQQYGLTTGLGLQNNEFGVRDQQKPAYSAWFYARYERLRFNGLRGNWEGGAKLNDYLADLLIKNADGSYSTNGEYVTHQTYVRDLDGSPCKTTSGSSVDSFATGAAGKVKALIGSQFFTGTFDVNFDSMNTYFGGATSVKATIYNIAYNNGGVVTEKTLSSTKDVQVANGRAVLSIDAANGSDAWYVELSA
ncbi:hypothetical protein BDZ90DRAFT_226084 [Jaminaea rosea]|uniref:Glycoside hydrolase n=1 Tax=Jaminaea rosea TaxID=1569628 RepID=A0A316UUM2_9BASI|nr:hypothetical protein BDZ90DRAFT_226084 [Jaminaea rosea]PWN28694.1 hypothetical protein BDZ90DRAFT_226084 [Jaminaea rosea]